MEEEEFVLSSQLAFSDDAKRDDSVFTPNRAAKRARTDSEGGDTRAVLSEQRPMKRPRPESVHIDKPARNENVPAAPSPPRSKVSSYHTNRENTLSLPRPIPFVLPDDDSCYPSVHSSPQIGAMQVVSTSPPKLPRKCPNKHLAQSIVQEIHDIPSPPEFSSDEDMLSPLLKKCEPFLVAELQKGGKGDDLVKREPEAAGGGLVTATDDVERNPDARRFVEENGAPPTNSKNSSYFSFSRLPSARTASTNEKEESVTKDISKPHESVEIMSSKKYYLRAFDYVVNEVLARDKHVLNGIDCRIVSLIKTGISFDAKALFVRIYRRTQPQWYRVKCLEESYNQDFDVTAAVEELCRANLVISSEYASQGFEHAVRVLARELLPTLNLDEVKKLCDCLVDSKKLKKLPKHKLIPDLRKILLGSLGEKKPRGKLQQMTLIGLTPSQLLAREVLKKAGHSIRIPHHVLTSLEKVHFLFFLEEGHDSPNVILADTGKAKFPDYQCHSVSRIFPSRKAFDDYRKALSLEQELDKNLASKSYHKAVDLGSIAELEVREFFTGPLIGHGNPSLTGDGRGSKEDRTHWPSLAGHGGSQISGYGKENDKAHALNQLRHPFFRRYTAQWVYVRACCHSVHAFECLREYETAVEMLKLLLSTSLVPKRRGKCLNRITINLFKHLDKASDALSIISNALDPKKERLHLGDRHALARRGAAIHKKLVVSSRKRKSGKTGVDEDRAYLSEEPRGVSGVSPKLPESIAVILNESRAKVHVRNIYGKSLNVQAKESQAQGNERSHSVKDPWYAEMQDLTRRDTWYQSMFDRSRDSQQSVSSRNLSLNSRAVFSSLRRDGGNVSVEEYCMEWYFAKEGWSGSHDEGKCIRFLFSLFMWESALFAFVPDVFQTPFQDKPLDLFTEAFYESRSEGIENRLHEISALSSSEVFSEIESRFERYNGTRAIGCDWNSFTAANLAAIGAGLGGSVLSHCFRLLSQDYSYWAGGLPDLILWKELSGDMSTYVAKFVEVKSARDTLSERQKAWLLEIEKAGALCEVCKVVERMTSANARELEEAKLDEVGLDALNAASVDQVK